MGVNLRNSWFESDGREHGPPTLGEIADWLDGQREKAKLSLDEIVSTIASSLAAKEIAAEVSARELNLLEIRTRIIEDEIHPYQIADTWTITVIVENYEDCYKALGTVHKAFPAIPERFKDLISAPRPDGYESLHTVLVGGLGRFTVHIRTKEMHRAALELENSAVAAQYFEMKARMAALEELVATALSGFRPGMGHNNPPEELDDPPITVSDLDRVLESIEIIKVQPQIPIADTAELAARAEGLRELGQKIGRFFAQKGDLFLTEATKTLGAEIAKWGVRATVIALLGKLLVDASWAVLAWLSALRLLG